MSYWKAYAAAREVPDAGLREALIEAMQTRSETLADVARALGDDTNPDSIAIIERVQELREQTKDATDALTEAEAERDQARIELEAKLKEPEERLVDELRRKLLFAELERDALHGRLAKVEPLLDAYSDTLAFARKFVSLAQGAGVKEAKPKARHVRAVKGGSRS